MKIKRILSSVLVAIMLFGAVVTVIPPVKADAAYASVGGATGTLTQEEVVDLVTNKEVGIRYYAFESARAMFEHELAEGYLVGVKLADAYSLYINRYTGYVYYINELTGDILTSNPWYIDSNVDDITREKLTSQLVVHFIETASAVMTPIEYTSSKYAAAYAQISVSPIYNGFRVNYSIGDTSDRVLLPAGMLAESFESKITIPMINSFLSILKKHEFLEKFNEYSNNELQITPAKRKKWLETVGEGYVFDDTLLRSELSDGTLSPLDADAVTDYLTAWKDIYTAVLKKEYGVNYSSVFQDYDKISDAQKSVNMVLTNIYDLHDPVAVSASFYSFKRSYDAATTPEGKENYGRRLQTEVKKLSAMFTNFPITGHWEKDGKVVKVYEEGAVPVAGSAIYSLKDNSVSEPFEKLYANKAKNFSNMIKSYAPAYTTTEMLSDEKEAGCEMPITPKAVFKVALEYTLNEKDGTLKIELPSNSISFDESKYTLSKISVLDMFGAVRRDSTEETYAFFPDGSGMVSRFADYTSVSLNRPLYGTDYAYSSLTADFNYLEQVTVPVFGMVSGDSGFVAVIEEGSALAEINVSTARSHRFATSYITVSPYPQDRFEISSDAGVEGGATSYSKTAETKYDGSYTMNVSMLTSNADEQATVALYNTTNSTSYGAYAASYVGMANRYRDFLIARGDISALAETAGDLPLYIEALGSMEYIKKILSFPVNSSLALTEFSDIVTMYDELSSCVETLMEKAKQKDADAEATDDLNEKVNCQEEAEEYRRLAGELAGFSGISNINFKLTGFANNGLSYTYPGKLKWERVCGGKSGFRDLVAAANDKNFGVYPDFDFMYIVNTEIFDGVGANGYISRQIDNRYASKQIYDPATGMYFPGYSSVVAADIIPEFFAKLEGRYADYNWKYLSLSTMGSTLNSDFDDRDSVHREDALSYVTSVFASAKEKGYSLMVDKGNAYAYKYADHIVDIDTDSSHHIYCSYTVPFIGMVLHGYKNYAGSPINYSGVSDYDILRSIESGANLLYILCYRNTSYMKEYFDTNKYYSVDYNNWYTDILLNYKELNEAIGGELQNYVISDHRIITAEKVINSAQAKQNYALVRAEFLEMVEAQLNRAIDDAYMEMAAANPEGYEGINLVTVDTDYDLAAKLTAQFESIVNTAADASFRADIMAIVDEIKVLRGHNDTTGKPVKVEEVEDYEDNTKYDFYTDSDAYDKDYDTTDNTVVNNNVVSVTYTSISDPTKQVTFLLNFNIYAVNVMVDGQIIPLDRYEYYKM